jgi:dTDP-4-dehydrorhamnose reductase
MNILLVGRGWTGKKMKAALDKRGHLVDFISHQEADKALSSGIKYDWVVNTAGVTGSPNVDACELDKQNTYTGNSVFPVYLYYLARDAGAKYAHFSSGCIYTGQIYSVDQEPNFFGSTYSISKGISDTFLKNRALVFRIRMPFTGVNEPKNFLSKILKYAKGGKLMEGGDNSVTDLDEAVEVASDLITENAEFGPYNLVNQGSINMHELAELLEIDAEWFTAEEFKAATAASRSNCTIPSFSKMRPVNEALKDAITKLKNT